MNERFNKSKVHSRLGERVVEDPEDSGDSLERDTGADLGEIAANMVIQVTQSDNEEQLPVAGKKTRSKPKSRGAHQDEAMDQDDGQEAHRDVDHRKRTKKPAEDLRSKITSQVVKIKTEKGLEDRQRSAREREDR